MSKYQKTYKQLKRKQCKKDLHIVIWVTAGTLIGVTLATLLIQHL